MDMRTLQSQYTKRHEAISYDEIMFLYDYHPWDNGKNPRIDKITNTLLNLKNPDQIRRSPAVNFFFKVLTNPSHGLSRLSIPADSFVGIVPSHNQGNVSLGLQEIIQKIQPDFKFRKNPPILKRTTTVLKAATGGPRSLQTHLSSIDVINSEQLIGHTIFLFDDITSTGNSLLACKQLLINAGAARVAMIALGKTHMEH